MCRHKALFFKAVADALPPVFRSQSDSVRGNLMVPGPGTPVDHSSSCNVFQPHAWNVIRCTSECRSRCIFISAAHAYRVECSQHMCADGTNWGRMQSQIILFYALRSARSRAMAKALQDMPNMPP